jgi:hypothetical protein
LYQAGHSTGIDDVGAFGVACCCHAVVGGAVFCGGVLPP